MRTISALRLTAFGLRRPSAMAFTARRVVAAFEVEEHVVVQRVHGELLGALARVHRGLRRLTALSPRSRILVRRVDAERGLALRPQLDQPMRARGGLRRLRRGRARAR